MDLVTIGILSSKKKTVLVFVQHRWGYPGFDYYFTYKNGDSKHNRIDQWSKFNIFSSYPGISTLGGRIDMEISFYKIDSQRGGSISYI